MSEVSTATVRQLPIPLRALLAWLLAPFAISKFLEYSFGGVTSPGSACRRRE